MRPAAIAFQQGLKFRLVLEESQFGLPLELQQQAGQQNGPDGHLRTGQKVGIEPPPSQERLSASSISRKADRAAVLSPSAAACWSRPEEATPGMRA